MVITLAEKSHNEIDDTPPVVNGELITYRGETHDLTDLPNGAEVEADEPFVGKITRVNGVIHATLRYFYCTETAEPEQSRDVNDYIFDIESGECPCPIKRKPEPVKEAQE